MIRKMRRIWLALFSAGMLLTGCGNAVPQDHGSVATLEADNEPYDYLPEESYAVPAGEGYDVTPVDVAGRQLPGWDGGDLCVEVNGNLPFFTDSDKIRTDPFEEYSEHDSLGRCGVAYANVCRELQPTEERGEIGSVKPSGWHTVKYNGVVSGNYLYNRCHLIGFQLAGENANERNLITGTRALNVDGMLPYENLVDDYLEEVDGHVLYRVTPIYNGNELVARGVLMEAYSVEDAGTGVEFCVFVYNAQPGVAIDYATGDSWLVDGSLLESDGDEHDYVLNTNSGKFHLPGCQYADSILEKNRLELHQTLEKMLQAGYTPCGSCHPDEE